MGSGGAAEASELGTTGSGGGGGVTVNIRSSNGAKFSEKISLDSTVGSFKSVLAPKCAIPAEQQRLIYKGRILKDDQTLESYGLEADHTVHLVRGFAPAASANSAGASSTEVPNSSPSGVRSVGTDGGGAFGGSGLGASLFEQVQQQLTENPNLMREIMDMPIAQNLMNDPDVMQDLMMNSPQMNELIDRNPELAHILNDPSTVRQTLEAARNPELMREMMRNTDRAMSNIESSPEGFNLLRRMYENVQEPFLNATTMAGDARNDLASNPFVALLATQGGGRGTARSTNPTSTGSETTSNSPAPNIDPLPNPWCSARAGGAQTNSTTRLNPAGDVRLPALGGLGGLGLLHSQPMFDSSLLDSNSQLREMMRNPEFIRQLTSLGTLEQLVALRQALLSHLGLQPSTREADPTGGGTAGAHDNATLETLTNMFAALGTGSPSIPNRSNVPPEELYATQLSQLQEMGFFDTRDNIQALIATAGNVHAAVERLLGNLGQ